MPKLITAVTLLAAAAAATVLAPVAAHATPTAPQPDQLVVCSSHIPVNVTVENLTYDSAGPIVFSLTGCRTIVDGSTADNPDGTPISATYRVAFEPTDKNPARTITILTSSGQTRTVQNAETTVQISALEGVQATFGNSE